MCLPLEWWFAAGVAAEAVAGKGRFAAFSRLHCPRCGSWTAPFKEAMLRDKQYLCDLDADRLLHTFRLTAGLPSSAEPYWRLGEAGVRKCADTGMGHFPLGLCDDVCEHGRRAAQGQRPTRSWPNWPDASRRCPTEAVTRGISPPFPSRSSTASKPRQEVWAPWYVLHKIMAGLLDVHTCCGNPQALERVEADGRLASSSASIVSRLHRCRRCWAVSSAA